MRGRKPKPTAVKVLSGNPGKRPLNDREPSLVPHLPRCPHHLTAEARKEWHRVVRELYDVGVLTVADRAVLAAYCQCYARWVEAEGMIEAEGSIQTNPKGYMVKSPWVEIAHQSLTQMRAYMVELGMTPSSRSRVKAVDQKDKPTLAEQLFAAIEKTEPQEPDEPSE